MATARISSSKRAAPWWRWPSRLGAVALVVGGVGVFTHRSAQATPRATAGTTVCGAVNDLVGALYGPAGAATPAPTSGLGILLSGTASSGQLRSALTTGTTALRNAVDEGLEPYSTLVTTNVSWARTDILAAHYRWSDALIARAVNSAGTRGADQLVTAVLGLEEDLDVLRVYANTCQSLAP